MRGFSFVSTHSHPKVAAASIKHCQLSDGVSTHSHPKVAALLPVGYGVGSGGVSTHSHPKVAAIGIISRKDGFFVSTHSHPKVAAYLGHEMTAIKVGFNTQPPEGGCRRI